MPVIEIPEQNRRFSVAAGTDLLTALKQNGIYPDAPCGGHGTCGKCRVTVDGQEVLACKTVVRQDMVVTLPQEQVIALRAGVAASGTGTGDYALAVDVGTTTVAAWLIGPDGQALAADGVPNPQIAFGADVVTRIRSALAGQAEAMPHSIHRCVEDLALSLCHRCAVDPARIRQVTLVGNPAMQQLFLGIPVDNLSQVPYDAVLLQSKWVPAADYIPALINGQLAVPANVSGFLGSDILAGVLATGMDRQEELCLLVDIGTNGEMVLGNRHRLVACSTAAGPALEGAGISCGMRAANGAIDHLWREDGGFGCSVIGNGVAAGICGSGLVDAVAAALDAELLNHRGRITQGADTIDLGHGIALTQEDIRQVQQAKGAIAAGIYLLAQQLQVQLADIHRVYLAGAFGSFLNPESVCRIGLLPPELFGKIAIMGNTAGSGARLLLRETGAMERFQQLRDTVEHVSLATAPDFARCFARQMYFTATTDYWCRRALALGFSQAVVIDPKSLVAREDVRAMCAQDKCGAYGKNWTCPPHIGTIPQCQQKLRQYRRGILVQTVGQLSKAVDTKGYHRAQQQHLQSFHALARAISARFPKALFLGAGGCRVCDVCAYPEPCRFPEQAMGSMEGYGLFVTQVCRDAGIPYHHGDRTITYTGCILLE